MDIHVVQPGDTMYRLAQQYGVSMERLIQDNQLPDPSQLVVGQTIVVQYPELTHTVRTGDSLYSIAQMHNTTAAQLLRNNPGLQGRDLIYPGQAIVVKYASRPRGDLTVNAYAYPYIDRDLLRSTLPYLSQLTPFTYRFDGDELIPFRDEWLVNTALQSRVAPIFHLSNLNEREQFSPELAHDLLEDEDDQKELIEEILEVIDRRGYQGVDVDFEFIHGSDAENYAKFLARLRRALTSRGLPLIAALAPKTASDQPGRLYEGIDYHLIAQSVDFALLMTYGWELLAQPLKTLQIRGLRNNIYTYLQKE
ncbi:MAG: LysM peptidoglycan-binding domain-containing protein, partial [Lawsonibacter sp.]|nr:LysM peptidoglycan-binding domain-containing protein [Lawsonibacter sp.]